MVYSSAGSCLMLVMTEHMTSDMNCRMLLRVEAYEWPFVSCRLLCDSFRFRLVCSDFYIF